jgi:DNA polymerase (family 10)
MQFDFVCLALHRSPRVNIANRFITAIEHLRGIGYTKPIILAHPSGRQFSKGDIGETDWDKLFDVCVKHDVILEINSLPERLDLDYSLCKKAKKKGIKFSISTDSHAIDNMDLVEYGISVARRAWLEQGDVVNTKEQW